MVETALSVYVPLPVPLLIPVVGKGETATGKIRSQRCQLLIPVVWMVETACVHFKLLATVLLIPFVRKGETAENFDTNSR